MPGLMYCKVFFTKYVMHVDRCNHSVVILVFGAESLVTFIKFEISVTRYANPKAAIVGKFKSIETSQSVINETDWDGCGALEM